MRKFFEGLSLPEMALIIFSILFGSVLRLYKIDLISHWSDELATLYYSKFIHLVFNEETHPPGFYLFSKVITFFVGESVYSLRMVLALMSVGLCTYFVIIGKKLFTKDGWIIFTILLFLIPVDVAYSRIARMYSPLFLLSMWFYLTLLEEERKILKLSILSFIMSWIFPIGFIPGGALIISNLISRRKWSKEDSYLAASVVPVFLYYVLRIVFQSKKQFLSDYLGGNIKVHNLFSDFFLTMAGDHIPKYPYLRDDSNLWMIFAVFSIIVIYLSIFYSVKKQEYRQNWMNHLIVILCSLFFIEIFSALVINIKVGRYLIFLIPIILIHAAQVRGYLSHLKHSLLEITLFFGMLVFYVYVYKPFDYFLWERESFNVFKQFTANNPNYIFCGNRFQYHYYFQSPHKHCMEEYKKLKADKKDFVFIDMNGFVRHGLLEIAHDYVVSDVVVAGSATIARAQYRNVVTKPAKNR